MLSLPPALPNASFRPILPKQTQLQKRTLAIHVPTPTLSLLINRFPTRFSYDTFMAFAGGEGMAGEGTIWGFTPNSTVVPVIPMNAERIKPGLERSIRYHRTGFTSASVKETWKVDCHGSLRLI